jgi:hypothetical protein
MSTAGWYRQRRVANMTDTPPPVASEEPPLHAAARLADRVARDEPAAPGWWLTRFVILRLLGLVYLMAFLTLVNQGPALLGSHGLLPLSDSLDAIAGALGSRGAGFRALPSIFWLASGDGALRAVGWVGVALSAAALLGYANALVLVALCVLQISIATVGGTFYGFGWELQLVETGFLCIFWMSPYHRRLDWLLWFAAMGSPRQYPWMVHLVAKLLEGDRQTLSLFAGDPFAGAPPRHVRVLLYRYRMTGPGAPVWWERELRGEWLPPLSLDTPALREFLKRKGWQDEE